MSPITARWMALLAAGLLAAACARSPEAQKARHLEHGDRYVQREQFREAIIEYRNVLRFDQNNGHAMRQLGLAHYQLGELAQAYQYLLKAQEILIGDRKSTRLNSSHLVISYAVFCLKKKNNTEYHR